MGGTNAWTLSNSSAAPQGITQTLNAPGAYTYCLSVYVRSAAPASATLQLGANQSSVNVESGWARVMMTGPGDASASATQFGLEVPSAATLNIFGMQVEAQGAASLYKPSTTGGVYPSAYFRDNSLSFISTDVNRNSVTVNIAYASSL